MPMYWPCGYSHARVLSSAAKKVVWRGVIARFATGTFTFTEKSGTACTGGSERDPLLETEGIEWSSQILNGVLPGNLATLMGFVARRRLGCGLSADQVLGPEFVLKELAHNVLTSTFASRSAHGGALGSFVRELAISGG